jgi:hypothetical protein
MLPSRPLLVRRGLWLNYLILAHNTVEAIVSIAAGVVAGSVALVGFGVDSRIEVTASVAYRFFLSTQVQRCEHDVLPPPRRLVPAALITYT